MRLIDPGHMFGMRELDTKYPTEQRITFVKRCDPSSKYPGNTNAYPGVIMQEVLRVQISRMEYLRWQAEEMNDKASAREDWRIIQHLRKVLLILEVRAARKHHRQPRFLDHPCPESLPTCPLCGHLDPELHAECIVKLKERNAGIVS